MLIWIILAILYINSSLNNFIILESDTENIHIKNHNIISKTRKKKKWKIIAFKGKYKKYICLLMSSDTSEMSSSKWFNTGEYFLKN